MAKVRRLAAPQVVVRRNEPVQGPPGPIVVCTRNDDLEAIVTATPPERRGGRCALTCAHACLHGTLMDGQANGWTQAT